MILKRSFLALTLAATLFSCSSDSSDNDSTTPNASTFLQQRITTYSDGEVYTETFNYDGQNLSSIMDSDGYKIEYLYENDMLTRINELNDMGEIDTYTVLEYDSENKLDSYNVYMVEYNEGLRFELTHNADGSITELKYNGDLETQDNLINESTIHMSNSQISSTAHDNFQATCEYDNKNGIYKNIAHIDVLNLLAIDFSGYIDGGLNNLTKITENDGGTAYVQEEYQYTYNAANYPATANYYWEGELESTIEYIYE